MKKQFFSLLFFCLCLGLQAQQSSVVKLTSEKLHARVREWPYPINGITVPTNAPALMWPATNGKKMVLSMESGSAAPEDPDIGNVRYQVMLATDKDFTSHLIKSNVTRRPQKPRKMIDIYILFHRTTR